jgi:RNA polymerase sigma factor (TIGR02999 family)
MQITDLLHRAHDGDREALNSLLPLVYQELKQLAMGHLRRERDSGAIEATVLVHEAFLRMAGSPLPEFENRSHFYGIAARVMRQVLVDMARSRQASKRGRELEVTLSGVADLGAPSGDAFLVLNEALDRLARENSLKGRLIELRFFAGLTAEESAAALSMPVHTVRREIRLALAWLRRELAGERA